MDDLFRKLLIILHCLSTMLPSSKCQTEPVFLGCIFEKVDLQNTNLVVYQTLYNLRAPQDCAISCAQSQSCQAFGFHPSGEMCEVYTTGPDLIASSNLRIFQFQLTDIFHTISVNGRIYSILFSSEKKTQSEARQYCNNLGGYLFVYHDQDEKKALKLFAKQDTSAWVGINDIEKEGHWVNYKDNATIDDTLWEWVSGEPNNANNNEDCATLYFGSMQLYDEPCSYEGVVLCNKDIIGV